MQLVTVRVPASTSNLGPGFDCLGVALRLYNDITIRRGRSGANSPMVAGAARSFFQEARVREFPFACTIEGDVPRSRGLGSSVTVRLGVIHALNELAGRVLARERIFEMCAELEGHPDNAAPSAFGGFNVVRAENRQRFAISPRLRFVLLIPEIHVETKAARSLLPQRIPRADAIANIGNASAITAAFVSQRYQDLAGAFADRLHQPYRARLIPILDRVIRAAESAGALGGFLSGSGSTIAALTLRSPARIAAAMQTAAGRTRAQTVITVADNRGARVLRSA
ncbi:MAG: homoserine kinase [Chthoniobacterales bacterium]